MSTVARHEQPSWTIVYNDEHRSIQGNPGEWATYASVQDIDGLQAYVLRDEASAVLVYDTISLETLSAPEPASFFSFSRFRASPLQLSTGGGNIHEWLYTVFGYLLPEYRVFLTLLPFHSEYHCESRSTPFVLL